MFVGRVNGLEQLRGKVAGMAQFRVLALQQLLFGARELVAAHDLADLRPGHWTPPPAPRASSLSSPPLSSGSPPVAPGSGSWRAWRVCVTGAERKVTLSGINLVFVGSVGKL